MLYLNNNGSVLANEGAAIEATNRSYLYGDGVFESIRVFNGKAINVENHILRLLAGAKAIKMRPATYLTVDFFQEKINELIQLSDIKEGGKCRISLDRVSGGAYRPESNEVNFFIDIYPYDCNNFELNSKGIEVDQFMDIKKHINPISNFKTKSGLIYVLAAIHASEKNLDDMLILNEKNGIIESSSCNIFIVSNGVLYTPGLDEGCLAGTMRMQVINLALANGIKVYESSIVPQNLLAADEIFFTNAIRGINWVSGYRTKRYFNNVSRKLVAILNDHWDNQLQLNEQ
jgi:branched-chain amino acid aminotransferase